MLPFEKNASAEGSWSYRYHPLRPRFLSFSHQYLALGCSRSLRLAGKLDERIQHERKAQTHGGHEDPHRSSSRPALGLFSLGSLSDVRGINDSAQHEREHL